MNKLTGKNRTYGAFGRRIANYKHFDLLYSGKGLDGGGSKTKYFWDTYSSQKEFLKNKYEKLKKV